VRQIRLAAARSCAPKLSRQGAACNLFLSMYVVGNVAVRRYDSRKTEEKPMAWTTPVLVEICVGLEINGYLRAEL
jgi:coenzyme PQQ precursor peptide PqqA